MMDKIRGEGIIHECAKLRGEYKFDQAIKLIEDNIDEIHPDIKVNAWLEAFKAAKEKGDDDLCKKYAKKVAMEDANVPSIQEYL